MAQETLAAPTDPPGADPAASAGDSARRLRELDTLRRMAVAAADTVSGDEIFALACGALRDLLAADFALAAHPLFSETREWHCGTEPPREARAPLAELLDRARTSGEPVVAGPFADGDGDGARAAPPPFGAATAIALPLPGDAGASGALLAGWHGARAIDGDARRLAETIAEQAAVAFRNAARYDAMQQAAVRRERFFSAMSHDLRTPITAIMGYSELLQDGIMGDLEPHQHDMVERICQVSGHLAQLVNDVLDIAKLDAGRMQFQREPVALGELVDEAVVAVEPQAASKGLALRLEIGGHGAAVLQLDMARVRQILVNLLSNAVKFTERGSVTLSAEVDGGRGWLRVSDTGPGLPAGAEEAVFEEFMMIAAGNKAKREPGSGLGLAISRRLARAMGGDLTAINGERGGAVFTLHLPPQP
jgi:signal transduction histidine kinase